MINNPTPVIKNRTFVDVPQATYNNTAAIISAINGLSLPANASGMIHIKFPFEWTGTLSGNLLFRLVLPTNLNVPSGSGFNGALIYAHEANGYLSLAVPFWTTGIVSGNLELEYNNSYDSLTVIDNGYFGIEVYGA